MVTQQILVLFFLVRVRVAQQKKEERFHLIPFFFLLYMITLEKGKHEVHFLFKNHKLHAFFF